MRFADVYFKPTASKYAGEVCYGLQTIVSDRTVFQPFLTALTLLETIRDLYPEEILYEDCSIGHDVAELPSSPTFSRYIDKLLATTAFSEGRMSAAEIVSHFEPARNAFSEKKKRYHLYE